jgi:hypothetical protein
MALLTLTPLQEADVRTLEALVPDARTRMGASLEHAWTAWEGTQLIACGGVYAMWPGVGNVWFLPVPGWLKGKIIGLVERIKSIPYSYSSSQSMSSYMQVPSTQVSPVQALLSSQLSGVSGVQSGPSHGGRSPVRSSKKSPHFWHAMSFQCGEVASLVQSRWSQ